MMKTDELLKEFFILYGKQEDRPAVYFAPGRVNLIGEHTDYNGGFVFPCALQYGTYLLIRKTEESRIKLASVNFPDKGSFAADAQITRQEVRWFNYPLGIMDQFARKGIRMQGMELLYAGDIPNGAGLSSSASIEMATAFALNELLGSRMDRIDLVRLSKRAENEFVGVNCGIMDMFAIGICEASHALFLNCHTLEYKLVPVLLPGYKLVIANTNKQRGLADSKYNERVAECQLGMTYLSQVMEISFLGEIGYPQFYKIQERIPDEVVRRRVRHVISENQRVLNAISSLLKNDLTHFGSLMNASHDSLRDNYEVTGFELDTMVNEARKIPGVVGARMTGAGFGGCTINLIRDEILDRFISETGDGYFRKTGLKADFYVAEVGDGVRQLMN